MWKKSSKFAVRGECFLRSKKCIESTRPQAFLLLELTVLLAIVAFVFSIGIPSFSCFEKARVRGEVEKLAAQVQYLQGLAVITGQEQEINLTAMDSIHFCKAKTLTMSGSKVTLHNSTFPNGKITCYPSGVVCAGTVYVTDQQKRYCYSLAIPVGGYYRYIREQDCKFHS